MGDLIVIVFDPEDADPVFVSDIKHLALCTVALWSYNLNPLFVARATTAELELAVNACCTQVH